jgi:hypothetical protein
MTRAKRAGLILVLSTALIGTTLVFLLSRTADSPITPENFDRIRQEMIAQEVEAILGPPEIDGDGFKAWSGPEWVATVYFDRDGRVSATMFGPQPSIWGQFRRWLRF